MLSSSIVNIYRIPTNVFVESHWTVQSHWPAENHVTNSWWINKPWHRNYSPLIHTFIMVLQNTNGDEFKANTFSEEIIKPYNATKTTPSLCIYFTLGCYRTWDTKHCQMMWCTTAMDCHNNPTRKNKELRLWVDYIFRGGHEKSQGE